MSSIRCRRNYFKLAIFIFMISSLVSCGIDDDSGSSYDPSPENHTVDGTWEGVTTTQAFGEAVTVFSLVQDGNNITGGTLKWTDSYSTVMTADITGSINSSEMIISAIFQTTDGDLIEFGYRGTISGDDYSGDVFYFFNGVDTREGGTFSFTKKYS